MIGDWGGLFDPDVALEITLPGTIRTVVDRFDLRIDLGVFANTIAAQPIRNYREVDSKVDPEFDPGITHINRSTESKKLHSTFQLQRRKMSTVKLSLCFLEELKPGWYLTCNSDGDPIVMRDEVMKTKPSLRGTTIVLFKPKCMTAGQLEYQMTEMISYRNTLFPTIKAKQEDLQMLKDIFFAQFGDTDLLSLDEPSQQAVFKVKNILPALSTQYGYRVMMKIVDPYGNQAVVNVFKNAGRFAEGGVYRVTGLKRPHPQELKFSTGPDTEVLDGTDIQDLDFTKIGAKEIMAPVIFVYDVHVKGVCSSHRHSIENCGFCPKEGPFGKIKPRWVITATCVLDLSENGDGDGEEMRIILNGSALSDGQPEFLISSINKAESYANSLEGQTVKFQYDIGSDGKFYASKVEIVEVEDWMVNINIAGDAQEETKMDQEDQEEVSAESTPRETRRRKLRA